MSIVNLIKQTKTSIDPPNGEKERRREREREKERDRKRGIYIIYSYIYRERERGYYRILWKITNLASHKKVTQKGYLA